MLVIASQAVAQESMVVGPSELVDGRAQSDWSREWWQWAGSFQSRESPIGDRTGELSAARQAGPCVVPGRHLWHAQDRSKLFSARDKYLFFPLINYVVMPTSHGSGDCASAIATASSMTAQPSHLVLEIDGQRVHGLVSHRQATKCFDMGAKADGRVRVFPSAANGYYVMMKPLPPCKHVLNSGGALPSMLQAVTYTLPVD